MLFIYIQKEKLRSVWIWILNLCVLIAFKIFLCVKNCSQKYLFNIIPYKLLLNIRGQICRDDESKNVFNILRVYVSYAWRFRTVLLLSVLLNILLSVPFQLFQISRFERSVITIVAIILGYGQKFDWNAIEYCHIPIISDMFFSQTYIYLQLVSVSTNVLNKAHLFWKIMFETFGKSNLKSTLAVSSIGAMLIYAVTNHEMC